MTITTTYSGTAREQWALAGIDLSLGRITAAELHELGAALMRQVAIEAYHDAEAARENWIVAEADAQRAQNRCEDAVAALRKAKDENRELKERVQRLETRLAD